MLVGLSASLANGMENHCFVVHIPTSLAHITAEARTHLISVLRREITRRGSLIQVTEPQSCFKRPFIFKR
jgi:hypothetical protein